MLVHMKCRQMRADQRAKAIDGPHHSRLHRLCRRSPRWLFPVVGFGSLLWFLVRVIPKPSRAAYPCQRVALPLASSFVLWLAGLAASAAVLRRAKHHFVRARVVAGVACLCVAVGILWLFVNPAEKPVGAQSLPLPNVPLGVARGVQPGRVVWIHEPNATEWEGYSSREHWYDDAHTDASVVHQMVSRAIRGLAGRHTEAGAWDALFRHFNAERGKGQVGYSSGEKIAIKINNTLCYNANTSTFEQRSENRNRIDNSPQMIAALLWQLVHVVGAAEEDITIGDPGRIMPSLIYDRLYPEYPNVCYLSNIGGRGRTTVQFSNLPFHWSTPAAAGTKQDFLPKPFAEASYFINFAILKSHDSGGITVCGKNLYGALIRNPDRSLWGARYNYYDMHASLPANTPGTGRYRCLVDLMGHHELGGKTLLYLVDGLFGGWNWSSDPVRWGMPPFNGDWPSSLFVSQDPVAMDSVCYDFLWTEWRDHPRMNGADDYLTEAALAGQPPSRTVYDPEDDGIPLQSLGVHEHWNDPLHKQYSRNLGIGDGIELTCPLKADFDGDAVVGPADLATLCSQWLAIGDKLPADICSPRGDGAVDFKDFAVFAQSWTGRRSGP